MKKSLVAVIVALACLSASAQAPLANGQTKPITPVDRAVDILTVFTVGWLISFGAVVTGNVKPLCDKLEGTYDPYGVDRCPDGQWRNL